MSTYSAGKKNTTHDTEFEHHLAQNSVVQPTGLNKRFVMETPK